MTSLKCLFGKSIFMQICYWWFIIKTIACDSAYKQNVNAALQS